MTTLSELITKYSNAPKIAVRREPEKNASYQWMNDIFGFNDSEGDLNIFENIDSNYQTNIKYECYL